MANKLNNPSVEFVTLPKNCTVIYQTIDGMVFQDLTRDFRYIVSVETHDNRRWLHLSMTVRMPNGSRLPTYAEIKFAKGSIIGDRKAIMVFPPKAEHVNINPSVLHLYACLDGDPLPDFTKGTGSI